VEARDLREAYSAEDLAQGGVVASWSNGQITLHVGLVAARLATQKGRAQTQSSIPPR